MQLPDDGIDCLRRLLWAAPFVVILWILLLYAYFAWGASPVHHLCYECVTEMQEVAAPTHTPLHTLHLACGESTLGYALVTLNPEGAQVSKWVCWASGWEQTVLTP